MFFPIKWNAVANTMCVAAGVATPNLGIVGWPLLPLGSFCPPVLWMEDSLPLYPLAQ